MSSKTIYTLLVVTLLSMVGILVWLTIKHDLAYYLVAIEVLSVIVIVLLVKLYQRTVKPLQTIISGMDLLKSQDFNSRLLHVKQPDADKIVDLFNKMLEQLKNERLELREKNYILDILIKSSPMGVIMLDLNNDISLINPAATMILACDKSSSYIGKPLSSLDNVIATELINLKKHSSKTVNLDDANVYKCAHESFIVNGYSHTFYLIEKLTDEFLLAQKKAYEKVIRMIAHEVNNSMGGITSMLDLVSNEIPQDDKAIINLLTTSSDRCLNLSRFITKFADVVKIPEPNPISMGLDEFISNNSRLFESQAIDKNIKFTFDLNSNNQKVMIDTVLMEQVVMNIIKNAVEAIDQDGEIELTTSLNPLKLVISNNGAAIDLETQQNLFTPFFSTKLDGQGIGLIVVRDILKKHHCRFNLKSDNDGITRFTIFFQNL
ncbi:MAG: ATP-binding protein [Rikenellaceae bacterium]